MFFNPITWCITLPLGFFQVTFGVGTPSALHVSVTVCPIQDCDVTGSTDSTTAASINYNHDEMCYSDKKKLGKKKATNKMSTR